MRYLESPPHEVVLYSGMPVVGGKKYKYTKKGKKAAAAARKKKKGKKRR